MKKEYTREEKLAIKKLMRKTKNVVMHKKYLVIHLHMREYTNKHIAIIVDLDVQTVGIYIKTYKNHGVDGLIPKKSPGRPRFLSKEQEEQLYKTIVGKTPDEVGFDGLKNWTAKIACQWVYKEFGVQYTVNGMLDLFHRLDLSYTRPTYVLEKADPVKQEEFKEKFEEEKKSY